MGVQMTDEEKSEIRDAWSVDSSGYDEGIKKQLADDKEVGYWQTELKHMSGNEPLHVLEVGCGPGFISIMMNRLKHKIKPIDGSEGMIQCANNNFRAEGIELRAQLEDAVTLPDEENESYDVILSRDVVWTLYDPQQAFQRWYEVLKPGGLLVYYDGDYRADRNTLFIKSWKFLSNFLILLTDHKWLRYKAHHDTEGAFHNLPMVSKDRPEEDIRLLEAVGFSEVTTQKDRYRSSPSRMEFWKYGYQGKKFKLMAKKPNITANPR